MLALYEERLASFQDRLVATRGSQTARVLKSSIRIAIDVFGTGHSSLSHLRRLPVDEITIDTSFVVDMAASAHDEGNVRSIVDPAHQRDLEVVAEAVEMSPMAGWSCDNMIGSPVGAGRKRKETASACVRSVMCARRASRR
jgi:predicted signal transduction protein with EAL and GGDEF domain